MIIFLLNVYLVLLFILVKLHIVPNNLGWKLSPIIVLLLLLVGLFIPMGWGAPAGPVIVIRHSVQIVPNVTGQVIEVPVEPNKPIKANDVLFRIDPVPYEAQVRALQAQLQFQELRLGQMTQLQERGTGRGADVEERQAEVDRLRAQLDGAKWNLDATVVRAPADGFVTNLALRKGARVANLPLAPVMAFIDTSDTIVGVAVPQIGARFVAPGQEVELTFKFMPGKIYTGRVEAILQAVATGQIQASGVAIAPQEVQTVPFVVRVALDDKEFANRLPAGSTGDAAIFTDRVRFTYVVRKVMLRQIAILNFVNPF
jgi:RND family efflux transporter MFP subunit